MLMVLGIGNWGVLVESEGLWNGLRGLGLPTFSLGGLSSCCRGVRFLLWPVAIHLVKYLPTETIRHVRLAPPLSGLLRRRTGVLKQSGTEQGVLSLAQPAGRSRGDDEVAIAGTHERIS